MNSPETLETERNAEQPSKAAVEAKEENFFQGAELLENPQDDSFQQGLVVFIAWVKTLLADDK